MMNVSLGFYTLFFSYTGPTNDFKINTNSSVIEEDVSLLKFYEILFILIKRDKGIFEKHKIFKINF